MRLKEGLDTIRHLENTSVFGKAYKISDKLWAVERHDMQSIYTYNLKNGFLKAYAFPAHLTLKDFVGELKE